MTSIVSGGGSLNAVMRSEPVRASREGFAVCNAGQECSLHDVVSRPSAVISEFMSVAMKLQVSLQADQVHELRAIGPEHFDMAYSDADPDWHAPTYQPLSCPCKV